MAGPEPVGELPGDGQHDREVGLPVAGERCRDRDQDRVRLAHGVVVGRRCEESRLRERSQNRVRDVLDVALAAVDRLHAGGVEVEEDGADTGFRKDQAEREAELAIVATSDQTWRHQRAPGVAAWQPEAIRAAIYHMTARFNSGTYKNLDAELWILPPVFEERCSVEKAR